MRADVCGHTEVCALQSARSCLWFSCVKQEQRSQSQERRQHFGKTFAEIKKEIE